MFSSDVRIWLAAGGVGLFLAGGLSLVAVRLLWRALVASLAAEVARQVQPAPEPQWLMRTEAEKRAAEPESQHPIVEAKLAEAKLWELTEQRKRQARISSELNGD